MDGLPQVFGLGFRARQGGLEQIASLLFHGMAIAGGAESESALGHLGEFAYRYTSHVINDIIDCACLGND
jgi:hypothetical protein